MKNLIIVRHAKSSWDSFQNDIDRPLEQRGKKDAMLVSAAAIKYVPETFAIYCSIAKRAYETCLIFSKTLDYPTESILFQEQLYTFDSGQLEKAVRSFNDAQNNVILFGHNEAITNFVNKFGDVFIDNVPTCGFILLRFDSAQWQSIDKGKTLKTIFPKDLK